MTTDLTFPEFELEFADLFNHIGLSVDERINSFERRSKSLLLALEQAGRDSFGVSDTAYPELDAEKIKAWINQSSFELDDHYLSDEGTADDSPILPEHASDIDLLIVDNDVAIDERGLPVLTDSRPSIAQDIKHMIRETGLLVELLGERDIEVRQLNLNRIIRNVDEDRRIIPGTARIVSEDHEQLWLTAKTVEFHEIGFFL